ncbi:MAG: hypothetical protein Q7T44_11815 [Parvibaculum sp.]|nr:hypothetical protein [Parvibaculum sp.]
MSFAFRRAFISVLVIASLTGSAAFAAPKDPYAVGTRNGPFVVSARALSELVKNGYEIKANLGNALILQKAASVFSCVIPPDPEHMSYRSYFVCSELKEQFGHSGKADKPSSMSPVPDMPRLKMDKPKN